jgi:hypothetical protein
MKKLLVGAIAFIWSAMAVAACSSEPPAMPDASSDDSGIQEDTAVDAQPDMVVIDTNGDVKLTCPNPKMDLTGFTPPNGFPPPHPPQAACDPSQLGAFWTACEDKMSTPMTCNAWRGANQKCDQCIESIDTDSSWGVLVYGTGKYVQPGTTQANFYGCLQLEGATQCANDDFALDQCERFVCGAQCPVTDNPSYLAYNSCTMQAQGTVCKSYYAKLPVSCTGDAGPAVMACKGANFQDYFTKMGPLFCSAGG